MTPDELLREEAAKWLREADRLSGSISIFDASWARLCPAQMLIAGDLIRHLVPNLGQHQLDPLNVSLTVKGRRGMFI